MGSTCDRMGCSAPATVVFGADPGRMIVVMQAVDPTTLGNLRPGILCTEHADRLTVPRGWTLDDQREPVPRLFRVPTAVAGDADTTRIRPSAAAPVTEPPFEQASLEEMSPSGTMPSDTVPSDTVPSDTVPSDTVPSDTVPSDTVPSSAGLDEMPGQAEDRGAAVADTTDDTVIAVVMAEPVATEPSTSERLATGPGPVADPVTPASAADALPTLDDLAMALEWDERDVDVTPLDDWTEGLELPDDDDVPVEHVPVEHVPVELVEVRELEYVRDPDVVDATFETPFDATFDPALDAVRSDSADDSVDVLRVRPDDEGDHGRPG